jgi:hypothetical protein
LQGKNRAFYAFFTLECAKRHKLLGILEVVFKPAGFYQRDYFIAPLPAGCQAAGREDEE